MANKLDSADEKFFRLWVFIWNLGCAFLATVFIYQILDAPLWAAASTGFLYFVVIMESWMIQDKIEKVAQK